MTYEAKTNWKYDDTVTEKDLNRIEQGLKDAHVAEYKDITLKPGVQIVDVPVDTPFRMGEIRGRTLINLLGRAGGCTDQTLWNLWQSSTATHSSFIGLQVKVHPDKVYGNAHNYIDNVNLGQAYVVVGNIENGTTGGKVRLETQEFDGEKVITSYYSNEVTNVSIRQPMHLAFAISDSRTKRFSVNLAVVADATEATGYFDSIRVYQIPEADVEKINAMTSKEVSAYYSYVDSMTNVTNPYAIGTSVNLLPPTYKFWNNDSTIISDYSFEFSAKENENKGIFYDVAVIPNRSYAVSFICSNVKGKIRLEYYKDLSSAGNAKNFLKPKTYHSAKGHSFFITPPNCGCVRVYLTNEQADNVFDAGEYHFSNFAIYLGDKPQPFAPQTCSVWAAECKLAANPVDGSNADVLYINEDGLPYVMEIWKKLTLDETFPWEHASNLPGFKGVRFSHNFSVVARSGLGVKYDGSFIPDYGGIQVPDKQTIDETHVYVWISNKDSGWGDNYNPTEDEIKAYFLGWKMGNNEDYSFPAWDGTGTKAWYRLYNGVGPKHPGATGAPIIEGTYSNTVPTMLNDWGFKPYRLQFLKAKPTAEAISNYETGLTLGKGWNLVEVGSGIVIREKTKAYHDVYGHWNLGNPVANSNAESFKHGKALDIKDVYTNNRKDTRWWHVPTYEYGMIAQLHPTYNFDSTAVYHVTYTMFLTTLSAPINGTIAVNLRGAVTDVLKWASDAERRLSVVEIQKSNKDVSELIQLSTLNGYKGTTKYSDYLQGLFIRKDSSGYVWIHGLLCNGTPREIIAKLPKEYRPKHSITFSVPMYSASIAPGPEGEAATRIKISKDGLIISHTNVRLIEENGDWLSLHLPPFLAEQ